MTGYRAIQDCTNPFKRRRLGSNANRLSSGSSGSVAAASGGTFDNIGQSGTSQSGFDSPQSSRSFNSIERPETVLQQLGLPLGSTARLSAGRTGAPGTTFGDDGQSSLRRDASIFQHFDLTASSGEHCLIRPAASTLTFGSLKQGPPATG